MAGLRDLDKQKSLPFKICLCKYCGRKFLNSQALGGHQNAHKKERQEAKNQKQEMRSMMMMTNLGMPLMPCAFIQPHGLPLHQITESQPFYSWAYASSSGHPVLNYWPGSYHLDEGAHNSHVPATKITNQVQGDVDDNGVGVGVGVGVGGDDDDHRRRLKLELPDLNLDPSP